MAALRSRHSEGLGRALWLSFLSSSVQRRAREVVLVKLKSEQQRSNCKFMNNGSDYISIIKANCLRDFCLDYSNNKQRLHVSKN